MRIWESTVQNDGVLGDAIEKFLQFKAASKLGERTIKDYKHYLQDFLSKSHNSLDCEKLKEDILNYFSAIPDTSPAVFNHPYQYIHSLMEWLMRQDYIAYNPFTKLDLKKRRDDGNIKPITVQQVRQLLKCFNKESFAEFRDFVIVNLIIDTGIRTSELVRLHVSDHSENQITLDKSITKTAKNRVAYLSPTTNMNISKLIKMFPSEWGDSFLFPTYEGKQMSVNALGRNFKYKYSPRLEFDVTPYQLRHTFATLYLQGGGDLFTLQKQMGHSSLSMTKRYTEITEEQTRKAHGKFSPLAQVDTPSTSRIKTTGINSGKKKKK